MKAIVVKRLSTIKQFLEVKEMPIKGQKGSTIITRLLDDLGEKPVGTYELGWSEYSGLQRHILRAKKLKESPLLRAKVLDYKGRGQARIYQVAVAKVRD